MVLKKGAASFGSIVATIGSILIACGFAWLIAQNWHQIADWAKILILVAVTSAAFAAGSLFKLRDYPRIGRALQVLGSLLYTLTIFLIAQIFSTATTAQGVAWLLLLCWVGVLTAAYVLESPISLVIGLIEFLIWLVVQFTAFAARQEFSPGMLALYFLAIGALFYGLRLLHRAGRHGFAKVYEWWTLLYVLLFAYVLSFQSLLPSLWPEGIRSSMPIAAFLIFLVAAAVVALTVGAIWAIRKERFIKKEIVAVIVILSVLVMMVFSTRIVASVVGLCFPKGCYDFQDQRSCLEARPAYATCVWYSGHCEEQSCYFYKNVDSCLENGCKWLDNYCTMPQCGDYRLEESCKNTFKQLRCFWDGANCASLNCYEYRDQSSCEASMAGCAWQDGNCREKFACEEHTNQHAECLADDSCRWQAGFPYRLAKGQSVPLSLWSLWIVFNIIFLGLILAVIGYGTVQKSAKMINLGIIFFSLDIVSRYIGFMMDFWGYTSLSIVFITGGALLLVGGWLIERWRRNLVAKTRSTRG